MELLGDVEQVVNLDEVLRVAIDVPTVQFVLPDGAIGRTLHSAYQVVAGVLNV